MTPIYSATIVAFSGAGLYYGFIIKRPLYGASVGFTTGVIPVALGILFGSKAFYSGLNLN